MKQLLKKNNVEMYSSYGNHKSAIVERFNRTLRGKMFKIFTEKNNRKWIHILQPLIKEYNNTRHSTIKMKPVQAIEPKNYDKLIENFNGKKISRYEPPKLKVGDHVRISRVKQLFEKGETAKWSLEVFKIREVIDSVPITYKISEWDNTPVEGNFYEQELQKTNLTDTFLVEKVLKKRKRKNINEVFVKWMGYNEKYNSWIKQSDVVGNFP
jgi:L-rhamnose mutarotase